MTVKEFFKKLLDSLLKFLAKNWIYIIMAVGLIVVARKLFARFGKVKKPAKFMPDPTDKHAILIYDEEEKEWDKVNLPGNCKAKDVVAAGKGESTDEVVVEIKHDRITDVFDSVQ